jgi:release factor glutamine methyltransferase
MDGKTLDVAMENAKTHGVDSMIKFIRTNWAEALLEGPIHPEFDLIVSNPPYLTPTEIAEIESTVSKFEPVRALVGGRDGVSAYRAIASQAIRLLKPSVRLHFKLEVVPFSHSQGHHTDMVCVTGYFDRGNWQHSTRCSH